jgi:hypothetical protein
MSISRQKDPHARKIEPPLAEFWQRASFEDFARQQGVRPVEHLEELLGGWPEDDVNDGFEAALERWRQESLPGNDA